MNSNDGSGSFGQTDGDLRPRHPCVYHFREEARATCAECGSAVCGQCFERESDGLVRCLRCLTPVEPTPESVASEAAPPSTADAVSDPTFSSMHDYAGVPWEDDESLTDGRAFVSTTLRVILSPNRFMERVNWERTELSLPLIYAVLSGSIGQAVVTLQAALMPGPAPMPALPIPGLPQMPMGALMLMVLPVIPLLLAASLLAKSWAAHVLLGFVGTTPRPFAATFKVFAYAEAASLLLLIPVLGPFADKFLTVFLILGGLRVAQGTGLLSGLLALLPVLFFQLFQL